MVSCVDCQSCSDELVRKVDGLHRGVFLTSALASSARGHPLWGRPGRCRNSPAPPASAPEMPAAFLSPPVVRPQNVPRRCQPYPLTKSAPVLEAQRISGTVIIGRASRSVIPDVSFSDVRSTMRRFLTAAFLRLCTPATAALNLLSDKEDVYIQLYLLGVRGLHCLISRGTLFLFRVSVC